MTQPISPRPSGLSRVDASEGLDMLAGWRYRTKREHSWSFGMESLAELRAREAEVAREWQWLHDALNIVARARAEHGDAAAFQTHAGPGDEGRSATRRALATDCPLGDARSATLIGMAV